VVRHETGCLRAPGELPMIDAVPHRRLFFCAIAVLVVAATGGVVGAVADPGSGQASAALNDCGGASAGGIGVGAYVPARGRGTSSVDISVQWYSSADGGWHPAAAGDSGWYSAGGSGEDVQTGYTFPYQGPSTGHRLVMRGVVSIRWSSGDSSILTTGNCSIGGGGPTTPAAPRVIGVSGGEGGKQAGVVRNHAGHPKPRKRANPRRVVHRPRVKVPARRTHRVDQTGSHDAPVGHDGVDSTSSHGTTGTTGQ
jgi:hypothetical protein